MRGWWGDRLEVTKQVRFQEPPGPFPAASW